MISEKYLKYIEEDPENGWFNDPVSIILVLIFWVIIILCIIKYIDDVPLVKWSVSENKCVKCIECSCSELPEKYEKIWVK